MIGVISEIVFLAGKRDDFTRVLIVISVINTLIALGLIFRLRAGYYSFILTAAFSIVTCCIFFTILGYSLDQGCSIAMAQ